jgi:hypothetical protein
VLAYPSLDLPLAVSPGDVRNPKPGVPESGGSVGRIKTIILVGGPRDGATLDIREKIMNVQVPWMKDTLAYWDKGPGPMCVGLLYKRINNAEFQYVGEV